MTMNAPAGPPICTLEPPSPAISRPAMIAVHRPASGFSPEAMANAIASGSATMPTVTPSTTAPTALPVSLTAPIAALAAMSATVTTAQPERETRRRAAARYFISAMLAARCKASANAHAGLRTPPGREHEYARVRLLVAVAGRQHHAFAHAE